MPTNEPFNHPKPLINRRKIVFFVLATFGAITLLSAVFCGPDLNAPGSGDVTGTWTAAGPAAGLTDIKMILAQNTDGAVAGTFTATGTRNVQVCNSPDVCLLSSTVAGVNTVLQVNLELKDAGTFTGQLIGAETLRGTMTRGSSAMIEFTRVPTGLAAP